VLDVGDGGAELRQVRDEIARLPRDGRHGEGDQAPGHYHDGGVRHQDADPAPQATALQQGDDRVEHERQRGADEEGRQRPLDRPQQPGEQQQDGQHEQAEPMSSQGIEEISHEFQGTIEGS